MKRKQLKRFFVGLVSASMILSTSLVAFAAEGDEAAQIEQTMPDESETPKLPSEEVKNNEDNDSSTPEINQEELGDVEDQMEDDYEDQDNSDYLILMHGVEETVEDDSWDWDEEADILTLNNADLSQYSYVAIIADEATIVMKKGTQNSITSTGKTPLFGFSIDSSDSDTINYYSALYCSGSLEIKGAGALDIGFADSITQSRKDTDLCMVGLTVSGEFIRRAGTLTISTCNVKTRASNSDAYNVGLWVTDDIEFNGGSTDFELGDATATGDDSNAIVAAINAVNADSIEFNGGESFIYPGGATVKGKSKYYSYALSSGISVDWGWGDVTVDNCELSIYTGKANNKVDENGYASSEGICISGDVSINNSADVTIYTGSCRSIFGSYSVGIDTLGEIEVEASDLSIDTGKAIDESTGISTCNSVSFIDSNINIYAGESTDTYGSSTGVYAFFDDPITIYGGTVSIYASEAGFSSGLTTCGTVNIEDADVYIAASDGYYISSGIDADSDVNISGSTVSVSAGDIIREDAFFSASICSYESINISDTTLTAYEGSANDFGYYGLVCSDGLNIEASSVISNPGENTEGAYPFCAYNGVITAEGLNVMNADGDFVSGETSLILRADASYPVEFYAAENDGVDDVEGIGSDDDTESDGGSSDASAPTTGSAIGNGTGVIMIVIIAAALAIVLIGMVIARRKNN